MWCDDVPSGQGTMLFMDGNKCAALSPNYCNLLDVCWMRDAMDRINSILSLVDAADRYVGMMKEGHHEGQGVMYYHNGDTYTGDATCVTCDV